MQCQHPKPITACGPDFQWCQQCGAMKRRTDPEWRIPMKQIKQKAQKQLTVEQEGQFEAFWSAYPRHDAKEEARKAWIQTEGQRPPITELVRYCKAYAEYKKGKSKDLIKHPASWLRGKLWEDESIRKFVVEEKKAPKIINIWAEKLSELESKRRAMMELNTQKSLKIAEEIREEIESLTKGNYGILNQETIG